MLRQLYNPIIILIAVGAVVGGCSPNEDFHGINPIDFYAENPIENNVETRVTSWKAHFDSGRNRLSGSEIRKLRDALQDISPLASDTVRIYMTEDDYKHQERRDAIVSTLHTMGYSSDKVTFHTARGLLANQIEVNVQYAIIIPPNCPDWRRSPTTTNSNTSQGNFNCASTVNLGAMVANPRDLVRGRGAPITPDTRRSVNILQGYHGQGSSAGGDGDGGDAGGGEEVLPDGGGI